MKTRHRIPSIFNLSMVDVLCYALGCVILLWLFNLREAKQKAAQAGKSDELVLSLRRQLSDAQTRLDELTSRYAKSQEQLSESDRQMASVRAQLSDAQDEARSTANLLEKAR